MALAKALESRIGAEIAVVVSDLAGGSGEPAFGTLLNLETLVVRRGRACWSDRITPDCLGKYRQRAIGAADLIVDLTAAGVASPSIPILRPTFQDRLGEAGLAGLLLLGITPEIVVERMEPGGDAPRELVHGVASLEAAAGIGGGMEAVWSRLLLMLLAAIEKCGMVSPMREPPQKPARAVRRRDLVRYSVRLLAATAARAAYRLCFHGPHWRIGWRITDAADDVWNRRDLAGVTWNVLRDPVDHFYADPFPFIRDGRRHIFFEALDHRTQKGIIACSVFGADGKPGPAVPIIEEPWHMSYPFVFEAEGATWMIPESSLSSEITLYRATDFPLRWERHATLVDNVEAADATIVSHGGKLWMFAVTRQDIGGYSDTLAIWMADRLTGPWRPHGGNPVLIHDRLARPAGHMLHRDGALLRPVQDCRNGYGAGLGLARITRLDEEHFEQVVETWLKPGPGWPGRKLHTLNRFGDLEVIDGGVFRPKWESAARLIDRLYEPVSTTPQPVRA
ncbi:MAG: hypothetical protein BGO05_23445 [Rhizobiales bacterium 63-7]|nr:MAG: hypothetical protein BGO05_23445 [Rhizobiales bacterium 63-7]